MKAAAEDAAERLLGLIKIAIDRESYEDVEAWLGACRIVNTAVQTALNTQLRADEGSLQAERISRLDEILAIIREEEKRLPAQLIEAAVA